MSGTQQLKFLPFILKQPTSSSTIAPLNMSNIPRLPTQGLAQLIKDRSYVADKQAAIPTGGVKAENKRKKQKFTQGVVDKYIDD